MTATEPKTRILIVDDEAGITRLLKLLIEAKGRYEVRTEHSGLLALAAAREFSPDLILLDLMMPGMSGADVAANLRKDAALKSIPLVFLTGTIQGEGPGRPPSPTQGYPCLVKPLNTNEVLQAIERTLSGETEAPPSA